MAWPGLWHLAAMFRGVLAEHPLALTVSPSREQPLIAGCRSAIGTVDG